MSSNDASVAAAAGAAIVPIVHGPILIGTIINVLLYGISLTQTFYYVSKFKNDRWFMKGLVFFLFVADTMNSVFDITYTYDSLVNHYDDPAAIATANWVFATDPAMVSLVACAVQGFFSWRVKVLTGNNMVFGLLLIGTVISGLGGVATSIAIGFVPNWLEFQRFKAPVIVWLVTSAVVDTTITAILTWNLRKHRTGFSHTDDVLDKIIRLTVQTGLITSVWAIVDLIVFLTIPTGIHLIFNFPLSKLYSNSLLSSLNARGNFTGANAATEDSGWKAKKAPSSNNNAPMISFHSEHVRPEVYVNVEAHEMSDQSDQGIKTVPFDGSTHSAMDIKHNPYKSEQAV